MNSKDTPTTTNAVALTWDGFETPRVAAKGSDDLAEKIIALARESGIPLHEDEELVRLLSRFELGEEIPPELYLAVATVIAFAYSLAGRTSVIKPREA